MGHSNRHRPKRGAKQVWPRKRAKRAYPSLKNWPAHSETKPLAFAGYKAGMTHVLAVDNRPKSPTKGEEIRLPVTIIECPDLKVAAIRLYFIDSSSQTSQPLFDVFSDSLDKSLSRKIKLPKKSKHSVKDAEKKLERASDVRLLVYTQPKETGIGKKKPELFELPIGGENVKEKFEYAKGVLGKSIGVEGVFKEGTFADSHSVTTGKGNQGVVKRFGVKLKSHKAEKGRRRIGTLGAWTPKKTPWWVPMAGQMGYHSRVEYNKQILKIDNAKENDVTPQGGFLRYGKVNGKYMLIKGSIPGPKKRLIMFTHAIKNHPKEDAPSILTVSRRSQQ